jgi:hypothetical protein
MRRTRILLVALAVSLIAGTGTAQGIADGRSIAPTTNAADSARADRALKRPTALIVLCFPGGGCIVCHNGYCEYTRRS